MALNLDAFWVAFYLTIVLVIGLLNREWRERRLGGDGRTQFYLAGRGLTPFQTAATIGATTVGGSATIVTAALVFAYGPYGLVADLAGVLGLVVLGTFFSSRVRRSGAHSLANILERSFGSRLGMLASFLLVLTDIGWVALLIKSTEGVLLGLNFYPQQALLASTLIFILYTALGGQRAVTLTDLFQISLVVVVLALVAGKSVSTPSLLTATRQMPLKLFITLLIMMFLSHIIGPDIYSKLLSSKDDKSAKAGALGGGVIKLVVALLIFAIVHFAAGAIDSGENVLVEVGRWLLPSPLTGLFLASLLAVLMSSADSCLLSASTMLEWDIFKKEFTGAGRTFIVALLGGAGYLLALSAGSLLSLLLLSYGLFTSSLALPALLSFILPKRRIKRYMVFLAVVSGSTVFVVFTGLKWAGITDLEPLLPALATVLFLQIFSIKLTKRGKPITTEE